MNWGVIGCGVIGERRSAQLPEGVRVSAVYDVNQERAVALAHKLEARAVKSLDELYGSGVQAVIIAAINSELVPLAQSALDRGIHVLIEKPAARSIKELNLLKNPKGAVIKIGFNHRFHPAFERLEAEIARKPQDPIMFIRAQYGNGSRLGFEKEWRANVELGGGGELLDQGVHVLDLASCLIPDLEVVAGYSRTHYWNMAVDDNTWAILRSPSQHSTFTFHVSASEWKNEFRFEVYTRNHKYQWLGLGRSYGPERLWIHSMKPEMGPPDSVEIAFSPEDNSWGLENANFLNAIHDKEQINGGFSDACRSLELVERIYQSSRELQGPKTRGDAGAETSTVAHPRWWKDRE